MNLLIILKVALRSLRRTLLRSSLTALGIIIGVAAVIALVSIGNGARARLEESLTNVDTNQLTLRAVSPGGAMMRRGQRVPLARGDGLNLDDYAAIREQITGFASTNLVAMSPSTRAEAKGRTLNVNLVGTELP